MFAVPFGRILWKEYRTQRTLWLCCLLFGFLFQVLFWWIASGVHSRATFLFSSAVFFPIMYSVGCGALLFANEREERTCEWLSSLSPSPAALFGAKVTFGLVSTMALQLVLAAVAFVLMVGSLHLDQPPLLMSLVPFGFVALAWSTFGSLVSRRVLTSVPAMAFWYIVAVFGPIMLLELGFKDLLSWRSSWGTGQSQINVLISCVFAVIVGADVWLGWRWCQGKYLDGSLFEVLKSRYERWWNELAPRAISTFRSPVQTEFEQPWRRTWQRLIWHERRRESLHLQLMLAGCVIGAMLAIANRVGSSSFTITAAAISLAMPMAMGVLGFRTDVNLQQPRFLVNRGIAPSSFWLAKQAVWLPRAFWITGVVFFVSLYCEWFMAPQGGRSRAPLQSLFSFISMRPAVAIWFVLLSYGCGQFAALLFQRVIIAIAFGALLNVVSIAWLIGIDVLVVPQWWSIGIPVAAMFLITLWQMRPWMLEDHSWSRRRQLVATFITVPVILVMLLANHRVSEAIIPIGLDQNLASRFLASVVDQSAIRPLSTDEDFVTRQLESLCQRDVSQFLETANQFVDLMKCDLVLLGRWTSEKEADIQGRHSSYLFGRANEYAKVGELDKALECYLANLKLERLISSRREIPHWIQASMYQSWALEEIVNWANHPAQTPNSIRHAAQVIGAELAKFPLMSEAIVATYLHDRKTWLSSTATQVVEQFTQSTDPHNEREFEWPIVVPSLLPWERRRLALQMTFKAELDYVAISTLETGLASSEMFAKQRVERTFAALESMGNQLRETTFLPRFSDIPLASLTRNVVDRQTKIRAALVRLELLAYSLEHGQLPERLVQLMPNIEGVNLVDPWSGRLFDFYPSFLLSVGAYEVNLIPLTAVDFEIKPNSPQNYSVIKDSPINYQELMGEAPGAASSVVAAMRKGSALNSSLFPIPPKPDFAPEP